MELEEKIDEYTINQLYKKMSRVAVAVENNAARTSRRLTNKVETDSSNSNLNNDGGTSLTYAGKPLDAYGFFKDPSIWRGMSDKAKREV